MPHNNVSDCDSNQLVPKRSIFMIDDCEDMLTLGKIVLEQEGFEVSTASNARDALQFLPRNNPDLILIDVQMKDVSGIDLVKIIKQKNPDLLRSAAVVFYSGIDQNPSESSYGFIRKNGDLSSFIKSVNSFIDRHDKREIGSCYSS